jgi:hypothetical protein
LAVAADLIPGLHSDIVFMSDVVDTEGGYFDAEAENAILDNIYGYLPEGGIFINAGLQFRSRLIAQDGRFERLDIGMPANLDADIEVYMKKPAVPAPAPTPTTEPAAPALSTAGTEAPLPVVTAELAKDDSVYFERRDAEGKIVSEGWFTIYSINPAIGKTVLYSYNGSVNKGNHYVDTYLPDFGPSERNFTDSILKITHPATQIETLVHAALTVPITKWTLLPNAEGLAFLESLNLSEAEKAILKEAVARILASSGLLGLGITLAADTVLKSIFENPPYNKYRNNMENIKNDLVNFWKSIQKLVKGRGSITRVTCYEGKVWVASLADPEKKVEIGSGEMVVVIGEIMEKTKAAPGESKPVMPPGVPPAAETKYGPELYASAAEPARAVAAYIMRGVPTYLIEPVASIDDISPSTGDYAAFARVLGNHQKIRVRGYVIGEGSETRLKDVISRTLQDFCNDALGDLKTGQPGNPKTRLVIRGTFRTGETSSRNVIMQFIKESLKKDRSLSDTEAQAVIDNYVRFIDADMGDAEHANTTIDLFVDLTMAECDRYGKPGQYDGQIPDALAEGFKRLLTLSLEPGSLMDFDNLSIEEMLKRIFDGSTVLKIRKVDWKSLDEWKKKNDELIRAV